MLQKLLLCITLLFKSSWQIYTCFSIECTRLSSKYSFYTKVTANDSFSSCFSPISDIYIYIFLLLLDFSQSYLNYYKWWKNNYHFVFVLQTKKGFLGLLLLPCWNYNHFFFKQAHTSANCMVYIFCVLKTIHVIPPVKNWQKG